MKVSSVVLAILQFDSVFTLLLITSGKYLDINQNLYVIILRSLKSTKLKWEFYY